ncbi:MAG: hypothetical protein L6R39_003121 [Caloplaca ligustica]|nr:MAG: hypothetical protein L6R39_003121 [Caloplaca ligustica]
MRFLALCYVFCTLSVRQAQAWRLELTEPFPPPHLVNDDPRLKTVLEGLGKRFEEAARSESSQWITNVTSLSIAVTSSSEALWTTSHTAPILGHYSDSLPRNVTDETYFRIASISKVFTVLAALIQQADGKWSLKDPITRWVPELRNNTNADTVAWEAITLGTLASQLSGIVRECQHVFLECHEIVADSRNQMVKVI